MATRTKKAAAPVAAEITPEAAPENMRVSVDPGLQFSRVGYSMILGGQGVTLHTKAQRVTCHKSELLKEAERLGLSVGTDLIIEQ